MSGVSGIEALSGTTKFADGDEASQIEEVIDRETKAIFCEIIGNPQSKSISTHVLRTI